MVMMGAGAFIVYAAVKGEHPWTMFLTSLGQNAPSVALTSKGTASAAAIANNGTVQQQGDGTVVANGYGY